jgi:hypothetical protein
MPLTAEPLLIDQYMPDYDLAVVHSRVFRAPPEQCFETVVGFDLFQIPVFRVLVGARGLPIRLAAALRRRTDEAAESSAAPRFRLRDLPSMGWMLLGERPGRELTFGQVGNHGSRPAACPATPSPGRSSLPSTSQALPSWSRAPASTPTASGPRS